MVLGWELVGIRQYTHRGLHQQGIAGTRSVRNTTGKYWRDYRRREQQQGAGKNYKINHNVSHDCYMFVQRISAALRSLQQMIGGVQ